MRRTLLTGTSRTRSSSMARTTRPILDSPQVVRDGYRRPGEDPYEYVGMTLKRPRMAVILIPVPLTCISWV